jgi:hypothetical protein
MNKKQASRYVGHLTWDNFDSALDRIPKKMRARYESRGQYVSVDRVNLYQYPSGMYAGAEDKEVWRLDRTQEVKVIRILNLIAEG